MTEDIIFRIVDMPSSIKATVSPSPDGCYNVYINARLNTEQQKQAAEHEIRHIRAGHFDRSTHVSLDEAEADGTVKLRIMKPQFTLPLQPAVPPPAATGIYLLPKEKLPLPPYREQRKSIGLTAYQVSKMAGISAGRYVRIEQGLTTPLPDELKAIEKFYSNKGAGI